MAYPPSNDQASAFVAVLVLIVIVAVVGLLGWGLLSPDVIWSKVFAGLGVFVLAIAVIGAVVLLVWKALTDTPSQ